jgi:hypothetical protein
LYTTEQDHDKCDEGSEFEDDSEVHEKTNSSPQCAELCITFAVDSARERLAGTGDGGAFLVKPITVGDFSRKILGEELLGYK